eukprot:14092317-Heterocapsa_arctica.AAC.1
MATNLWPGPHGWVQATSRPCTDCSSASGQSTRREPSGRRTMTATPPDAPPLAGAGPAAARCARQPARLAAALASRRR